MWKSKYPKPEIDDTYNEWTVLESSNSINKRMKDKIRVRCSCGTEKDVLIQNLVKGYSKSCGHTTGWKSKQPEPLPGKTFNEWTVIEDYRKTNKDTKDKIRVQCTCGKERDVYIVNLINGHSKSCGHNQYKRVKESVRNGKKCYDNRIGETFGYFTLTSYTSKPNKRHSFDLTCRNGHVTTFNYSCSNPKTVSQRKSVCWCQETDFFKRMQLKKGITPKSISDQLGVTRQCISVYKKQCETYGKHIANAKSDSKRQALTQKLKSSYAFEQLCTGYQLSASEQDTLFGEFTSV